MSQELITETYKDLAEGAKKGYGKDWMKFPADGKGSTPLQLKKNLYAFSGAKTYSQLEQLNQLLYDKDGKLRPFNEFSVFARKINRQYNLNYLQAEYQTARTAAQMAEKWERLQETKDLFPNLKFRTVGDSRVRDEHQKLNGIIKPIDDVFWTRYYPPLDWRCRCDVVATAEGATNDKEEDLPKPQFKGNVGIDKEIFTKKGTFFKLLNTNEDAKNNVEFSKLNAPNELAHKAKSGKKVEVNIFADRAEREYNDNLQVAIALTDKLNFSTVLRAHLYVDKWHNPEYLINGKIADRKSPTGLNLRSVLGKANLQECEIVVIDLKNNSNSVETIENELKSNFRFDTNYPNVKEIIIVSKDRKTVKHYLRKDFKKKKAE